ncbi:MAG: YIP1 family protein [Tannerellaceae bacterium]|jgi:hypothetical protein|nr:YIP1 family protein [Tannerellaceae bacterium]
MEILERTKALLLKPKEEWEVIEAENASHEKVFFGHLLILALIPAAALFFHYWWEWHSKLQEAIQIFTTIAAEDEAMQENLEDVIAITKVLLPLNAISGIIDAAIEFVIIVAGAYVSAVILNALSDNFGVQKDFNRAFTLVAYSYTPLCVAGLLNIYPPLIPIVPYIGLYGIYLFYIGVKPIINPPVGKATTCFIMGIAITLATCFLIPEIVQPVANDIRNKVETEQVKEKEKKLTELAIELAKKHGREFDPKEFQRYWKDIEKELEKELEKQRRKYYY